MAEDSSLSCKEYTDVPTLTAAPPEPSVAGNVEDKDEEVEIDECESS